MEVLRGQIWDVRLDPVEGSEMGKTRPCLVISNDVANHFSARVVIAAISSSVPRKSYPFLVQLPDEIRMPRASWVHCEYLRTVDKGRLGRFYGTADTTTMARVEDALRIQLGL